MTTSGTTASTLTVRQVIDRAMKKLAIIASGETFTSDEAQDVMVELNLMLKSWQADVNLWREDELTLTASTRETVLEPRCIDVLEARAVTSYERPLARWEWGQYVNIPTKNQTGYPSCYTVKRDRDETKLILWPVPAVPTVIDFTAARVIEDVTDLEQTLDVPQEWLEAVILNLAVRIAPDFGDDSISRAGAIAPRAELLLTQMRDLDRPASYYMGPTR